MVKTNIVDWETITNFVIDAFVGYGVPRADAEICADVLCDSYGEPLPAGYAKEWDINGEAVLLAVEKI